MKNLKSFRIWVHGLGAAAIGGAATAGSSWAGMSAAKAAGIDVPVLNWNALGVICVSGAVMSVFGYLKQSPLPPVEVDAQGMGNPS